MPFANLEPKDSEKLIDSVRKSASWFIERNLPPVFVCPSIVRRLVISVIQREIPGVRVVSIEELLACKNQIEYSVEGEISFDDE